MCQLVRMAPMTSRLVLHSLFKRSRRGERRGWSTLIDTEARPVFPLHAMTRLPHPLPPHTVSKRKLPSARPTPEPHRAPPTHHPRRLDQRLTLELGAGGSRPLLPPTAQTPSESDVSCHCAPAPNQFTPQLTPTYQSHPHNITVIPKRWTRPPRPPCRCAPTRRANCWPPCPPPPLGTSAPSLQYVLHCRS